jgi:hypothetical protein
MRHTFTRSVIAGGILALGTPVLCAVTPKRAAAPVVRYDPLPAGQPGPTNTLRFSVTNPNRSTVWVYAQLHFPEQPITNGRIDPMYSLRTLTQGKWKEPFQGWCGTGSGPVAIEPGVKRHFFVPRPGGKWEQLQAGVMWWATQPSDNSAIAWSTSVRPDKLPPLIER